MTQVTGSTGAAERRSARRTSAWPWWGVAAGVLGFVATGLTDVRAGSTDGTPLTVAIDEPGFVESLDRSLAHAGVVAGYVTVALLLVLAAVWSRRVLSRVPESSAARLVPMGLVAAAAALSLGYGWKGALAIYLPGGSDHPSFDLTGLYVYYMLNDFGGYIGWLGVVVSAGAVAWMALRERTVSRWIGVVSLLPVLVTAVFVVWTGLPGAPALTAPFWMVIAFAGLALGRSAVAR